jgi:hypothetical protein
MDTDKRTIIQESVKRGENKLATRSALISQGFGTEGFDALYAEALTELGVSEPKEKMPTSLLTTGESALSVRFEKKLQKNRIAYVVKLILFLAVCSVLVFAGTQALYPLISKKALSEEVFRWGKRVESETGLNPLYATDSLLQAKVESTAASANLYVGRMGFFEGVCKDNSVVAPVQCTESSTGFAVFVPLSNGTYFCIDRSGFRDILPQRPLQNGVCIAL